MATQNIVQPIPSFDKNNILSNPKFKSYKDSIKNNLDAYKRWIIISETANPVTMSNGGKDVTDDIINSFNLNPSDIEKEFDVNNIPDELKKKIDENPEEYYINSYNQYTYGKNNIDSKIKMRPILGYSKSKLIEKGKNPDEVLNKNPFISGLNFVANVVNVPVAILAKGYAGLASQSDKVKIWGGGAWEDALKAVDNDSYIKELVNKTSKNIPLTSDEKKYIKDYDNRIGPLGLLLNIVADPTIIAGAIGKGIGIVSKGLKGTEGAAEFYKISKAFDMFSQPFKTVKDISMLKNLKSTGEIDNILKTNLQTAKEIGTNILNKTRISQIDSLLKEVKIQDSSKAVELLEDIANVFKQLGKNQEYGQIFKSNELLKDTLFKIKTIEGSKTLSGLAKKYDSFKSIINNNVEKTGIRKLFLSEVPKEAKKIVDNARRLHSGLETAHYNLNNKLIKQKNLLKNDIIKNSKIKNFVMKNDLGIKNIDDLMGELIEKPKFASEFSKKFNIGIKAIDDINKAFDNYIIEESKYIGDKAMPMFGSEVEKKQYSQLANKFMDLNETNKYNPEIQDIEYKMRQMLKDKVGLNNISTETVDMMTDNINYLTHVMTPEAKKLFLEIDSRMMGKTGGFFRSYISNPSFKKRGLKGSVADINKYILGNENMKVTPFSQDIIAKADIYKAEGNIKDYNETIEFANKMNELGIKLRQSGSKFFENNIDKLLAIRAARSARTIQQSVFYKGMKDFGIEKQMKDGIKYEKPRVNIPGLMDKYFHPDIASVIEKFYNMTKDDRGIKKIFNFVKQFSTFWKSSTLAFPSTILRNILGNIMNSMLVVDNPSKYIASFKDAILATKGSNYRLITNTGKNIGLNSIYRAAIERGLLGTTLRETDIIREIGSMENKKGISKVLSNISGGIEKTIPFSKMNDMAEGYSKLALFIDRVKSGKSFDEAADEVYKVLFDYSDLTSLDKGIRSVIPFWTFMRKNLPLQVSNILSIPSRTIVKTENSINQNRPSDDIIDERFMSGWMKDAPNIRVGKDKIGKPQYLMLEGLIPFFDISRIVRIGSATASEGPLGGLGNIVDDTVKDMSPLIKTPIELITNRDFNMRKDIEKSKYATSEFLGFEINPKIKAILNDWRYLNTLNKGIDLNKMINKNAGISSTPEKDMAKMLFSWTLGSLSSYDVNYSKNISTRDFKKMLESELNDFTGYMNKIQSKMMMGEKLKQSNVEYIRGRAKKILLMMNEGFADAKIESKDRGMYAKRLYNLLVK